MAEQCPHHAPTLQGFDAEVLGPHWNFFLIALGKKKGSLLATESAGILVAVTLTFTFSGTPANILSQCKRLLYRVQNDTNEPPCNAFCGCEFNQAFSCSA
jgi:hypothetical protein